VPRLGYIEKRKEKEKVPQIPRSIDHRSSVIIQSYHRQQHLPNPQKQTRTLKKTPNELGSFAFFNTSINSPYQFRTPNFEHKYNKRKPTQSMAEEVYRKVGRGGAGNFWSKQDIVAVTQPETVNIHSNPIL